jgi:hypothetical protein
MKLKEKLKNWIKNWLFKEEINNIKEIIELYEKIEKQCGEIKEQCENVFGKFDIATEKVCNAEAIHKKSQQLISESQALLSDCHKFMNSICDVGTDIGFRSDDHSWAVICIHGKMDYVKFVDMNQKDIHSIVNFLKNFEYSNRVTDSPLNKRWIEDMILRM